MDKDEIKPLTDMIQRIANSVDNLVIAVEKLEESINQLKISLDQHAAYLKDGQVQFQKASDMGALKPETAPKQRKPGKCKYCDAPIWWPLPYKSGGPENEDFSPHRCRSNP